MRRLQSPAVALLFVLWCVWAGLAFSEVSWSPIGPGGGGWLATITVVDDALNTVYVGCDVGGVYKSTDHGATWEIKDNGLSIYYVEDIAYDPQTPSTLYAGTRGGVYKSIDGGDHWVEKRTGFPPVDDYAFSAPVSDLVVDPRHPNIVFAGIGVPRAGYQLDGYHWATAGIQGAIYKSIDWGESWTLIRNTGIDTTAMVYSLAMDPGHSEILYAATSTGVYKSITSGETWTLQSSGLPTTRAMALAVDPENSQILFVTVWAQPGSPVWLGGVYKSTDGGEHWIAKNNGLPQVMGSEDGFTSNFPAMVIDPHDPQTLYVGNSPWTPDPGVYKTTNGGDSWTWVSRPDPPNQNMEMGWITQHGPFAKCLAIDPGQSNRLFFGTSTHVFKTDDGGDFWGQVCSESMGNGYWRGNGMETTVVQAITVDPTNSDNIYAGYWDMGFLKSADGGISYKRTTSGMTYDSNTFAIVVDPADPAVVYAATGWWEENQGEVCKSTDYGENWTVLGNGLPDAQIWSLVLDPTSPPASRTLYATSYDHGVYKTVDGGQHWSPINTGLGVEGNLQARVIALDPGNTSVLYAGFEAKTIEAEDQTTTIQGGIFKSLDAGSNWVRLDESHPQATVWDIVVDPTNSQVIYTAVKEEYDHTVQETFFGGVYQSTDGGASWTNRNNGFGAEENLRVTSVAISPTNSNIVYATTSDDPFHDHSSGRGIFKSTDSGNMWTPINNGLGVLYFGTLALDPANPARLYAGSDGNGILKGIDNDSSGIDPGNLPSGKLLLAQNYPNPFNPRTVISFVLPAPQVVNLGIYDVEGHLVDTLLQERLAEGAHHVSWDGRNVQGERLASGLYFYRLKTGTGVRVRKMTMIQ